MLALQQWRVAYSPFLAVWLPAVHPLMRDRSEDRRAPQCSNSRRSHQPFPAHPSLQFLLAGITPPRCRYGMRVLNRSLHSCVPRDAFSLDAMTAQLRM